MVRGPGKFGKPKRGGGRSYSKDVLHKREEVVNSGSDESSELSQAEEVEEEGSEEESEEEPEEELSRAERRALKKQQKEIKSKDKEPKKEEPKEKAEDGEEEGEENGETDVNLKQLTISDSQSTLSRRQRETLEKQRAKENYWKLHSEGKTPEAQADLARLQKIKAERELAQAKRKAEAEAKAAEAQAKKSGRRA